MTRYDQAVEHLTELLAAHDSVRAFQKAQQHLQTNPDLEHLAYEMKGYQQDAVLFSKIQKEKAEAAAGSQADKLQDELASLPVVQDYRAKMQDASDLLQYVTKTLEEKINEELANGK